MVYCFQLVKHPNTRYRGSVSSLSRCELLSMLKALGLDLPVWLEEMGGASFLCFACRALTAEELLLLSRHSSVVFMAERDDSGSLHPLSVSTRFYLTEDLPEVLKYKGKTSAAFTRMMVNTALSLTPYFRSDKPVTVLDPLCGRGTTLFYAASLGFNAVGLDLDQKDLKEARDYFSRYLKLHLLKHTLRSRSETVNSAPVPVDEFLFSDSKDHYLSGDTRSLTFCRGDAGLCASLMRRSPAHVIAADLPYGVQHAPQSGSKPESFRSLLFRILPRWADALAPEGAVALSFNTLTLPTRVVHEALAAGGFSVVTQEPFDQLEHEVDQSVQRNLVFAVKDKGGSFS